MNNIMILESGERSVEVRLEGETVWLNLNNWPSCLIATNSWFRGIYEISMPQKHLLARQLLQKNATVQIEGSHEVQRAIEYYSSGASSICCAISPCSAPLLERTGGRPGQDHCRRDRGRADQARRECGQVAQIRPLPAVLGLMII